MPRPQRDEQPGRTDAIIDRLHALYPRLIDLSLDRIKRLLAELGDPQLKLPPVIHVAGTNGKGSVCAFLRAIGEAAGWPVHVTISPHLVSMNERFRVAGSLVTGDTLAETLMEIEQVNAGQPITVFEALIAAGYLLFARTPARLCVVEVGLGGRFDATNVIPAPAACAITSISLDHQDFLGDRLDRIAWEKAGIMKPGRPVATGVQPPEVREVLQASAAETGAVLLERGRDWNVSLGRDGLYYQDRFGNLHLPSPALAGEHQIDNAGIAIAAARFSGLAIPAHAYAGIAQAQWPARMQRLTGRIAAGLPKDAELYLDGGHNPGAGQALAAHLRSWGGLPVHLIIGMKKSKDVEGFIQPLLPYATSVWAIAEPGQHLALPVEDIIAASHGAALPGPDLIGALDQIRARWPDRTGRILICGSLYLAGEVLKADQSG